MMSQDPLLSLLVQAGILPELTMSFQITLPENGVVSIKCEYILSEEQERKLTDLLK